VELARDIVHEGAHGVDDLARGRNVNSRAERKESEIKAYTAQASFFRRLSIFRAHLMMDGRRSVA
jgi:hypothetical protein